MIRNILVPVAGDGSDEAAFAAANVAARLDGAHLQFLHVRLDVVAVLSAMSADASVGATMLQSTVDDLETDAQAGVARAQAPSTTMSPALTCWASAGAAGSARASARARYRVMSLVLFGAIYFASGRAPGARSLSAARPLVT